MTLVSSRTLLGVAGQCQHGVDDGNQRAAAVDVAQHVGHGVDADVEGLVPPLDHPIAEHTHDRSGAQHDRHGVGLDRRGRQFDADHGVAGADSGNALVVGDHDIRVPGRHHGGVATVGLDRDDGDRGHRRQVGVQRTQFGQRFVGRLACPQQRPQRPAIPNGVDPRDHAVAAGVADDQMDTPVLAVDHVGPVATDVGRVGRPPFALVVQPGHRGAGRGPVRLEDGGDVALALGAHHPHPGRVVFGCDEGNRLTSRTHGGDPQRHDVGQTVLAVVDDVALEGEPPFETAAQRIEHGPIGRRSLKDSRGHTQHFLGRVTGQAFAGGVGVEDAGPGIEVGIGQQDRAPRCVDGVDHCRDERCGELRSVAHLQIDRRNLTQRVLDEVQIASGDRAAGEGHSDRTIRRRDRPRRAVGLITPACRSRPSPRAGGCVGSCDDQ